MKMVLEPYILFSGNCEEALHWYKGIFAGDISQVMRWKDSPPSTDGRSDPALGEKIMHSHFTSNGVNFMAADARLGNNFGEGRISLSLGLSDQAETKRLYDALSAGGKIEVPLDKTFWSALFAMFTDKYGVDWMMNCPL